MLVTYPIKPSGGQGGVQMRRFRSPGLSRSRGMFGIGIALLASLIVTPLASANTPPAEVPGIIHGTIFRDLNNNGELDDGEPGIPDIVVSAATSTVSDLNGEWSMPVPTRSVKVRVSTGWYRSQCNGLDCPVGPGADNDFAVVNQFITTTADGAVGARLDVGLLPDWPGYYPIPAPVDGAVPANDIDVATRLSWIWPSASGNCYRTTNPKHHGCAVGDTPKGALQISNEGTLPLEMISGYIEVPSNTTILPAVQSVLPGNSPAITGLVIGALDPVTRRAPFELIGTLPPGAAAQYVLVARLEPGSVPSPAPLLTANPYVPNEMFVTITNPVDPDGCLAEPCPRGQHDKQAPADNTDFHGWQVIGGLLTPQPPRLDFAGVAAGSQTALNVTLTNTGPSQLQINSFSITGDGAPDYSLPDLSGCSTTPLAPGITCTTEVLFAPTALGPRTATITFFSDGAPNASLTVTGRIQVPPPVITSISPSGATPLKSIVITGTEFDSAVGTTTVTFPGAAPVPVVPTDGGTKINVTIPASALQGTVKVTTDGGIASYNSFVVRRAPSSVTATPTSGLKGATVVLRGNNFKGTTSVTFNGTKAQFTVNGPNKITVTVPAAATSGPIKVTNPWGSASTATFTVTPAP